MSAPGRRPGPLPAARALDAWPRRFSQALTRAIAEETGLIFALSRGVPPSMMEFELTETTFVEISLESLELLERPRARGCRFAIDDFGTG